MHHTRSLPVTFRTQVGIRCLALAIFLVNAMSVLGADGVIPGKVELYATWSALGIELPYTGDDNHNVHAEFVWRKPGEVKWRNGVDMTIDRQRRMIWASVWPLEEGDTIHVRLNLTDPDGGSTQISEQASLKKMNLDWSGLKEYYVAPTGTDDGPGTKEKPFKTLARAVRQAKPGTLVQAMSGIYAEADLFAGLKGTLQAPIVFAAAPGQTPIIDSSLSLPKGHLWKDLGNQVFVTEVMFDGGYFAQDGLRSFHYPTLDELQADKLQVGRAWYYDKAAKQLYVRTGTSSPATEHIYNLSQHAYGLHMTASQHVIVRGFTIRYTGSALVRISEGAQGCILLENKLHNGPSGIFMKSESTRDNAIWKNEIFEPGMDNISWTANYAYSYPNQALYCDKAGRGNSFCHNRIHNHFDLISVESWKNPDMLPLNRDCDILFNEVWHSGDDAIEADGGGVNMRISGNSIRECFAGLSLAPIERGPVYVTRNTVSFLNLLFKFNVNGCTSSGCVYLYHNTGYCQLVGADGGTSISFPPTIPSSNKVLKNNIVISNEWSVRAGRTGYELDGNCYFHVPGKGPRRFEWNQRVFATIDEFRAATGQESHGLYADPLLHEISDVGKIPSEGLFESAPKQSRLSEGNTSRFSLQVKSPCLDAAVPLKGINDEYIGSGPDMGAVESH